MKCANCGELAIKCEYHECGNELTVHHSFLCFEDDLSSRHFCSKECLEKWLLGDYARYVVTHGK